MEGSMRNEPMQETETEQLEDIDQCPECGHSWANDEPAHYHDCRYFTLEDETVGDEEEHEFQNRIREAQLSIFHPTA